MMDSGERRRQRERDTGPLLEETHDKQVNESGRLESVCLWRNYTSKKIPPKRRRPRTKGPVTRRTCRRDWMAKNTRPMAPGQKVPRRLCAGNRPEQLTRTTWARRQALLAGTGSVDPTLSYHESLTGHTLTSTLQRNHPGSSQRIHGTREGVSRSLDGTCFFRPVALDYRISPGSAPTGDWTR